MTSYFSVRNVSRLFIVLLALALVLAAAIGINGIIGLSVALGIIKEPAINFAVIGNLMILAVWAGLLVLIAGLVMTSTHGLARKGAWISLGGLVLLVVGSGPLAAVGIAAKLGLTADPNPNPVGFGILAFLTFFPALLLLLSGAVVFAIGRLRRA